MQSHKHSSGISSKIWSLILLLLIVAGVFILVDRRQTTISIIGPEKEQVRAFTGEITPGMTILDALALATEAGNVDFKYAIDSNRLEIYELGEFKDDASMRIYSKINNRSFNYAEAPNRKIRKGDRVNFYIERI